MQTLRKKTSPLKYKNETTRFLGDGVSFKAKLIGILEVSEARGDRMCQEALSDLKMAIRAAGEHKQRITINVAIDGLRLRDEKTGDSLYHHPVHKISFIAQDMTDSRAFGYIFGSPDTGHRFFGIKTDKAASQVVIAMRDLFQVVFALKKKEIELAKQHLDKNRFTNAPMFSDSVSSTKSVAQDSTKSTQNENKTSSNVEVKSSGTAVADLVDLELELNSLQQGLTQMERITPSDPFGSKDDPFGDSFTSYSKPILPPPPSSGKDKPNRSSETSGIFSPRTLPSLTSVDTANSETSLLASKEGKSKKEFVSQELSRPHQESITEDWFIQSNVKSVFEEEPLVPEPTKDEKHEMTKQEILSQFDVFTELDPLGTGRSKPYIDKKHFFQELKNPPKKVLNDLVSQAQQQETSLNKNFTVTKTTQFNEFGMDPFGEDPFVTEDPFAETDFSKQDPFEKEFRLLNNKLPNTNVFDVSDQTNNVSTCPSVSNMSKSTADKNQTLMLSSKRFYCDKQHASGPHLNKTSVKQDSALFRLHEHASLDISSESESTPEPPPRPESTLVQIKPPPLPPKKQGNEFSIKPPPRPPHVESSSHYDYVEDYETDQNSLEFNRNLDKTPPIPTPLRKSKFNSEHSSGSEKLQNQLNIQSSDEDYLTPITFTVQDKEVNNIVPDSTTLLPPPQRSVRKQIVTHAPIPSRIDAKSEITTTATSVNLTSLDGLDITLSQLTLSGLNELAEKLNIPANQLNNMTLVQLTNYLSNFIKSKTNEESSLNFETNSNTVPTFTADFAANFNNLNSNAAVIKSETYDRYAVFRELINEEIKQTKIDTEPEELNNEETRLSVSEDNSITTVEIDKGQDKYAALREIVEGERQLSEETYANDNKNENEENVFIEQINKNMDETGVINVENKFIIDSKDESVLPKYNLIEYSATSENKQIETSNDCLKSPKSPANKVLRSPIPLAITEIVQSSTRLNSGSLSDVVSGSSPEVDNTGSNSELGKKMEDDAAGESWAIFDQGLPAESKEEKHAIPSEEGVSPWSSDSKEFGNSSPPAWRPGDSESGGDQWMKQNIRKDQEGWWDTSAEPEMQYYPNRRSTDSYEDEYYECYARPRRRRQTGYSGQGAGGHSSSSRDVSPWEEEPRRREQRASCARHARQHSFEKYRERRYVDSWDDEDDYEYEEEHVPRYQRPDRQKWETERERYNTTNRENDVDKWDDDWTNDRRHRRRRDGDRERRCCPDWDVDEQAERTVNRYVSGRWTSMDRPPAWRDRKHDDRYRSRDSQESPWEDDYSNEAEEFSSSHYLTTKRTWKRPSSASEMDKKAGELKSRHYLVTGGSDGERERRYKPGRRSRSRDSQYSEPTYRYKSDVSTARNCYRSKPYSKQFDNESTDIIPNKHQDTLKAEFLNKKCATLTGRKKSKENPKSEVNIASTFPRKAAIRTKSLFENDFVTSEDTVTNLPVGDTFNFENDFETSEAESPTLVTNTSEVVNKHQACADFPREHYKLKSLNDLKVSRLQSKSKSLFEDDFLPSGKSERLQKDSNISNIQEEIVFKQTEGSIKANNFENVSNSRRRKNNQKFPNHAQSDINIKKSESVNIFARESDPFDDDFFSDDVTNYQDPQNTLDESPKANDLKWNDDFIEDFDTEKPK